MKRNRHNLTHSQLWTAEMGKLYPLDVMDITPTDRIVSAVRHFTRMNALQSPAFATIRQHTHSWYIPSWLLWDDFEDFITGADETLRQPKVHYPIMGSNTPKLYGTLWDFLGYPVAPTNTPYYDINFAVDALPLKAFWMIYDFFYRDEDLQPNSVYSEKEALIDKWIAETSKGGLVDYSTVIEPVITLPRVSWKKDIFTTARPWQQKGSAVGIPIDGNIVADGTLRYSPASDSSIVLDDTGEILNTSQGRGLSYAKGLKVDNVGVTINQLALASALARRRYKDSRYGSRYAELLQSMGANSADARLKMPQFLGGGSEVLQINEVLQTSQSTSTSSLGEMAGRGVGAGSTRAWKREFNEHGYLITMSYFRPDSVYMNICDRGMLKDIREDYYFKEFENVGLTEVYSQELSPYAKKDDIFGYNDMYYWMRNRPNRVKGDFRTTELHWHLARDFGDKVPVLNSSFIECNPRKDIFSNLEGDTFKIHSTIHMQAYRQLSKSAKLRL